MNRCRRSLASPLLAALVLLAFPAAGCSQAGVAIVRLLTKTGGKTVAKAASKQVAAKSAGAAAGKAAVATEASVALRPVVTCQADDLVDAANEWLRNWLAVSCGLLFGPNQVIQPGNGARSGNARAADRWGVIRWFRDGVPGPTRVSRRY